MRLLIITPRIPDRLNTLFTIYCRKDRLRLYFALKLYRLGSCNENLMGQVYKKSSKLASLKNVFIWTHRDEIRTSQILLVCLVSKRWQTNWLDCRIHGPLIIIDCRGLKDRQLY